MRKDLNFEGLLVDPRYGKLSLRDLGHLGLNNFNYNLSVQLLFLSLRKLFIHFLLYDVYPELSQSIVIPVKFNIIHDKADVLDGQTDPLAHIHLYLQCGISEVVETDRVFGNTRNLLVKFTAIHAIANFCCVIRKHL